MEFRLTTLRVRDMEVSLAFYHDLLGIEIAESFENAGSRIAMLGKPAQTMIELISNPNIGEIIPGNGVSIGLEMDAPAELLDALKEKGYAISGPISPVTGLQFFFVNDPDGYTIQLIETLD